MERGLFCWSKLIPVKPMIRCSVFTLLHSLTPELELLPGYGPVARYMLRKFELLPLPETL